MRLAGKVALITGGASGMGQSEATIFARAGAKVIVGDLLEAEGCQTVEKIASAGGQGRFVTPDGPREAAWRGARAPAAAGLWKVYRPGDNPGRTGAVVPR